MTLRIEFLKRLQFAQSGIDFTLLGECLRQVVMTILVLWIEKNRFSKRRNRFTWFPIYFQRIHCRALGGPELDEPFFFTERLCEDDSLSSRSAFYQFVSHIGSEILMHIRCAAEPSNLNLINIRRAAQAKMQSAAALREI